MMGRPSDAFVAMLAQPDTKASERGCVVIDAETLERPASWKPTVATVPQATTGLRASRVVVWRSK